MPVSSTRKGQRRKDTKPHKLQFIKKGKENHLYTNTKKIKHTKGIKKDSSLRLSSFLSYLLCHCRSMKTKHILLYLCVS